jgi:hypothetical protein
MQDEIDIELNNTDYIRKSNESASMLLFSTNLILKGNRIQNNSII